MSARTPIFGPWALLAALVFSASAWSPAWAADPQRVSAPPAGSNDPGRPHAVQVSFGVDWLAPESVGTGAATLTTNANGGSTTTFFTGQVSRTAAPAFVARVGYNLTRIVTIEGGFLVSRSPLEDVVSGDAAHAPGVTITGDSLTQYVLDVSVVGRLPRLAFASGAAVPFLEGGGGYLRQVHEGNVAIDTGQIYHFGGGVTYMFRQGSGSRHTGVGLRVDAQLYVRHKGFSVGTSTQGVFGAVGAGLVVAF